MKIGNVFINEERKNYNMGLNSEEKKRLEQLSDLQLVEHLLRLQYESDDFFNKREMNRNNLERYEYYHKLYYDKISELIEVKYMVCGRMIKGK